MTKFRVTVGAIATFLIFAILIAGPVSAQRNKEVNEASRRAERAARVLNTIMEKPDSAIPNDLLSRAEAVAVFPGVFKAAFGIGGTGGKGLITRKQPNGTWSAPAFFKMGGGSFGPQIGARSTDFILLFMNEDGVDGLLRDRFEIGTEASVAAGPVGRTGTAGTTIRLEAGILSYSRSRGLFAGLSLTGAVITPDNDLNRALYGATASDVLTGVKRLGDSDIPVRVRTFPRTVARHAS